MVSKVCRRHRRAAVALVLLCCSAIPAIASDAAGAAAGAVEADGTGFKLTEYRGKVVYLNFWASWCKPCHQSFPWMIKMQERFGERGFEVVAVDMDRDPKAAAAFLAKHPVPFRILHDPEGKMAEAYKIEAMPTSILYDRGGRQRFVHLGFKESDTQALESEIASLLAEASTIPGEGNLR